MPSSRPSLQDRIRQRQHSEFVGRDDQLSLFQRNFGLPIAERIYIFNVFGQGGVGKSTLLRRYREIATASGALTAFTDHAQTDVLTTMDQLAGDLARQGHELRGFADRYRTYRQRRQELESEPDAPTGLSSLFARTLVKGSLSLARGIPVGGGLVDLVDSDAVASKTGEWVEYVARKLRNNADEIRLVREPVEELTRLWLDDLNKIAEKFPVILFFDTYERTAPFLDTWLRDLLASAYGPLPDTTQLVIAGRDELDRNLWSEYESVIARLSLAPFTEQEARDFLAGKGVTNERVVAVILHLSGRLPLLVATLAAERPDDPTKVGDPSGTAVERFLVWTEDATLRRAAVDAALPRLFNRDLIALLVEETHVDTVFDWLRRMPFVEERADGWVYHDVVREQMLRYKRRESQQSWAAAHARLADYYERRAGALNLAGKVRWRDATWRAAMCEASYHKLCDSPHIHLATALSGFVECRDATNLDNTAQLIEPLALIAEHTGDTSLRDWAIRLQQLIAADRAGDEVACIEHWQALLRSSCLTSHHQSIALAYVGISYYLLDNYPAAIDVLTQAIDITPNYARAFTWRGATYWQIDRYEEALANLAHAIELDTQDDVALAYRGATYRLLDRHEEALADLTRASELDPEDAFSLAQRGATYWQIDRHEEALADLTRAIELDPEDAWALALRGATYRELERCEEALADLSRAIELDPQYAQALAQRGATYRLLECYEEALADLSRAIELDPQYTWALAPRGATYRELERCEEALADLSHAIELDPQDAFALAQRGATYRLLQRYEEALADFACAVELDPQDAWALAERGVTYRLLQRYEEALADLTHVITPYVYDDWAIYQRALVQLLKGDQSFAQSDFATAIQKAQEHYEQEPNDWTNSLNLSIYLLASGDAVAARKLYDDFVPKASIHALNEAAVDLDDYLASFPDNVDARVIRADLQAEIERRQTDPPPTPS